MRIEISKIQIRCIYTHTCVHIQGDFYLQPRPYRLFPLFEKVRSLRPKRQNFPLKKAFQIQKMTKQDKETIDKRFEQVPESDKTVCWETELVLGCKAQDRCGARVFRSFADIVAVMLKSLASVRCLIAPLFIEGFLFVTTKTLRKSVRQNSVQIYTASNFPVFHALSITVTRQIKLVSFFRRPTELVYKKYGLPKSHQEDIYGLTKSAINRQKFVLPQKMVATKDTSVYQKNQELYGPRRP